VRSKRPQFFLPRRLLIIAGAGSGKTEVMARRIAWLVHRGTPKDAIVAFTFTEKAAEEMKFRIRKWVQQITPEGEDITLGGMYIGTIHGYCLKMLREYWPETFYNFDILDELGRLALVQKGYHGILGMKGFEVACAKGQFAAIDFFLTGYDLLQEYGYFEADLPSDPAPDDILKEAEWVKKASLRTNVRYSGDNRRCGSPIPSGPQRARRYRRSRPRRHRLRRQAQSRP
jgi:DNA helicase-2/ATP-dependent DNA helicase PcrA